jgi:hypothetical protein
MDLDNFDEDRNFNVVEDLGSMGAVTGNQAMSAFPGKGIMPFVDTLEAEDNRRSSFLNDTENFFNTSNSVGYVIRNSDGKKVPYEQLPLLPSGYRDMTGVSNLQTYK